MNIAMLSYHTCPLATLGGKDSGGMNVYVRELTHCLGAMGVHVDVFTRSQDEHVPHVLHDLGYGNRVVHIPAGPEYPVPKPDLPQFLPQFVAGIEDFALQKNIHYDLIHSHYWLSGIAAKQLKEKWNAPAVQMFHTLGAMKQRIARTPEEAEGDYRLNGEKEVIQFADRIVAATPAELAQLLWLYQVDAKKVVIIPPGVNIEHFYPIAAEEAKEFIGISHKDQMILYVGRIEPLKGIDNLLHAIAIMRSRGIFNCKKTQLSVIGGETNLNPETIGGEMARLQAIRKQYDLNDLVAFLGSRSQDTLPYYYSAAEVVVVPSHYESFGMVALEAMACGTPVVASHVGGLAFLVQDGETGFTVPVDDPEALADKLIYLLENPSLKREMGMKAAAFAHEYAWQKIANRIIALYQETLN